MFDQYKAACTRLTLGQDKLEEMISMTENTPKKRLSRPIKTILIAAACVAALSITAFAASPAGQEAIQRLFITVRVLPAVQSYTEDGHTYLVVDDETIDITQELEENGSYTLELEDDVRIDVDSDGWVTIQGDTTTYTYSITDGSIASANSHPVPRSAQYSITMGEDGEMSVEADTPGSVSGFYRLELEDGAALTGADDPGSAEVYEYVPAQAGASDSVAVINYVSAEDPDSVGIYKYVPVEVGSLDSVGAYDYVAIGAVGSDSVVIDYTPAE